MFLGIEKCVKIFVQERPPLPSAHRHTWQPAGFPQVGKPTFPSPNLIESHFSGVCHCAPSAKYRSQPQMTFPSVVKQ